jgi:restriction endonuclease S subunit
MQKSQLEGASRLDAEYYQPDYLRSQNRLMAFKTSPLSSLCKVTDGNHSSISECFIKSGVRYLRGQDLTDFFISYAAPIYIPENVFKKLRRSHIFKEDVLVSIVGTIGLVSIVAKDFDKLTGNCKIAILHTEKIDPWYLAIFLVSKYGQNQIHRKVAGAVQTGIILKDLAGISIPVFNENEQAKIRQIAINAYENKINSEALYSQAEDLLLEELGLKDYKPIEELSYIIKLSDVKSAHRVDAEYYQPKYEKLTSKIKNGKIFPDILKNVPPNFNPADQPDKIFRYVELSNIDSSIGVIDGYSEVLGQEAPSRAKRILKTGDVIVSSVQGSLGKVALVSGEQDGFLASTGFFQLRSKGVLPEVLLVLAKSSILQMQLEKQCAGTILTAVPKEGIKNLLIPILEKSLQEKISDLVHQSHKARKKAKELLEKAKREVEEFIEKK